MLKQQFYAISVRNKNDDEVFSILAPYMTDAKGEISKKLKISLEKQENGKLEVKLSADKGFIKDSGRSFPVVIDPDVSLTTISSHFIFGEANHSGYLINHGPYYVDNTNLFLGNLEYYVTPSGVKENIVLKESDVQNEFYITYNIGALSSKQIDD